MKRLVLTALFIGCMATPAFADLDVFLSRLNVQARADMNGFALKVGAQFGVPVAQVNAVVTAVADPADAFMVFQLGEMAHQRPEVVLQTYQRGKGKGWGVLAKELGIKPGSAEFHALKAGNLSFTGEPWCGPRERQREGEGEGEEEVTWNRLGVQDGWPGERSRTVRGARARS
jgi:hypothetical protein